MCTYCTNYTKRNKITRISILVLWILRHAYTLQYITVHDNCLNNGETNHTDSIYMFVGRNRSHRNFTYRFNKCNYSAVLAFWSILAQLESTRNPSISLLEIHFYFSKSFVTMTQLENVAVWSIVCKSINLCRNTHGRFKIRKYFVRSQSFYQVLQWCHRMLMTYTDMVRSIAGHNCKGVEWQWGRRHPFLLQSIYVDKSHRIAFCQSHYDCTQVSNIGFITVHGLNEGHIASYTDIEFQLTNYQTHILQSNPKTNRYNWYLKKLLHYCRR